MYLEIDKIKREVTMSMVLEYYGIRLSVILNIKSTGIIRIKIT